MVSRQNQAVKRHAIAEGWRYRAAAQLTTSV